jgi:hypothetical protein
MAARLEWKNKTAFGGDLMLGGWPMASVWSERGRGGVFKGARWEIPNLDCTSGGPYESAADAFTDCESEVRRLLKEAGCEVEP